MSYKSAEKVFDIPTNNPVIKGKDSPAAALSARPKGFEPPAFRIGICCSIQLSYGRITNILLQKARLYAIIVIDLK